jgi:hypothetical protein
LPEKRCRLNGVIVAVLDAQQDTKNIGFVVKLLHCALLILLNVPFEIQSVAKLLLFVRHAERSEASRLFAPQNSNGNLHNDEDFSHRKKVSVKVVPCPLPDSWAFFFF